MKTWPTLLLATAAWLPMPAAASGFVACDIEGTVLEAKPGAEERTVEVEVSVLSAVRAKLGNSEGQTDCREFPGTRFEARLRLPAGMGVPGAGARLSFHWSAIDGFGPDGAYAGTSVSTRFKSVGKPPEPGDPDSPEFDPVAQMQRFHPGWEPPAVPAEEVAKHPLGSPENPVRSHGPTAQRDYLARLRCPDGKAPQHRRTGNIGYGIYGYHVDRYEVTCGEHTSLVHMDLYHPRYIERAPVPSFELMPLPAGD